MYYAVAVALALGGGEGSVFRIYRESHSQSHYRIFCFDLLCFPFLSSLLLYFIYIYIYIYIGGKYCPARARAHFLFFPLSAGTQVHLKKYVVEKA